MDYKPGDRVQLSDGNTYTFLLPIQIRNDNYYFLSCEQNKEAFRLGKVIDVDGRKSLTFVFDEKLLQEAQKYITEHENEL